jgi:uncharacterized protein
MRRTLVWSGVDAPRMEIAYVDLFGPEPTARGTIVGVTYEVRYELEPELIRVGVVGGQRIVLELGDADFFDVAFSPFFNSLPVLRDGLLQGGEPRDYVMRFVDVPSLETQTSEQRYEPLGGDVVRFRSGSFTADLVFDADGFVLEYPGLARRVG